MIPALYRRLKTSLRLLAVPLLMTAGLVSIASLASAGALTWTINSTQINGSSPVVAVDGSNNYHLTYVVQPNNGVKYIKRTGGTWGNSEVVDGNTTREFPRIALDAQGNPHVAYLNTSGSVNWTVLYKKKTNSWPGAPTTVGTAGSGTSLSLVIDPSGYPHVAFFAWTSYPTAGQLYHWWQDGAGSHSEVVVSSGLPQLSSLACDAQGNLHLVYFNGGSLKYRKKTTTWSAEEIVDSSVQNVGLYPSVTVAASNSEPHVSYYDLTNADLKYAFRLGGTWTNSVVESAGDVGQGSQIRLGYNETPMIGYWAKTGWDVKFALKGPCGWDVVTIDAAPNDPGGGALPKPISLATRTDGYPVLFYFNYNNTTPGSRFAEGTPTQYVYHSGPPMIRLVGSLNGVADPHGDCSMVIWDSSNNPAANIPVTIDFTGCPDVRICTSQSAGTQVVCNGSTSSVTRCTDASGQVTFTIIGKAPHVNAPPDATGCGQVSAYGQVVKSDLIVAAFNQNDDETVNSLDISQAYGDMVSGHYFQRSDFDGNGVINGLDISAIYGVQIAGQSAQGCSADECSSGLLAGMGNESLKTPNPSTAGVAAGITKRNPDSAVQSFELPRELAFSRSSPNPSTGRVMFRIGIPEASRGARQELALYDLSGRRIRTVLSGAAVPGWHEESWDFRTDDGSRARAGMYFARFRLGEEIRRQTVVLVE